MDYKETILTQKEFEQAEKTANWKDDYNPILDAQAKKGFEAGIKEVVDWINNSDSSCQEYFSKVCFDNNDWRRQIKEWGIEDK
jgi:hypothetical protein